MQYKIMKDKNFYQLYPDGKGPGTEKEKDLLKKIQLVKAALDGDKSAEKEAREFLDEFEEICRMMFSDSGLFGEFPDGEDFDDGNGFRLYEKPTLKRPNVAEYHLRIKLNGTSQKIWREVKVPSNVALDFLAHFLIDIMGWEDRHLCQFIHKNTFYTDEETAAESFWGDVQVMSKFTLSDLLKEKGDRMQFEYDFGDGWKHDVWVKGIREYEKKEKPSVSLVKGQGECPPEDCGGVWGYEHLLDLLQKKRLTKEEREELEWAEMDKDYNPDLFAEGFYEMVAEDWDGLLRKK